MKIRNYAIVTAGYWAFTVTDGALRMLVLLHFHGLGYSPVSIAFLFLAYELMGVVTNLLGGWVGARFGLNRTLLAGLGLQVLALAALTRQDQAWAEWLSVVYVMGAQALSGVAKDLTKMSSKSAVKLVAGEAEGRLFRLVALLTGSKNALKGIGFFVGAALLAGVGYDAALWGMAAAIAVVAIVAAIAIDEEIGRAKVKPNLGSILSKSSAINRLSAARFFLFGSRDIWFVVALPIFLTDVLGWSFEGTGAFLAAWVIGYGGVQSIAPRILQAVRFGHRARAGEPLDDRAAAIGWVVGLTAVAAVIALLVSLDVATRIAVPAGLIVFGIVFAVNSSLHSYLILAYSSGPDDVALDVGFYYSANAAGRLAGTLGSGLAYLWGGLELALWVTTASLLMCWVLTLRLPAVTRPATLPGWTNAASSSAGS